MNPLRLLAALKVRFWSGIAALVLLSLLGALTAIVSVARASLGLDATVISSGSMEPSISPGDVVLLRPEVDDPTVGMVVRFADPDGGTIVHRIRDVQPEGYVTRGDANTSADSGLRSRADLLGVGVVVVPSIGTPLLWWADGEVASLSAALLALVIAGWLMSTGALNIDPWSSGAATAAGPLTGRRVRATGPGPARGLVGADLAGALQRAGVPLRQAPAEAVT
jgi:signal peptidase I